MTPKDEDALLQYEEITKRRMEEVALYSTSCNDVLEIFNASIGACLVAMPRKCRGNQLLLIAPELCIRVISGRKPWDRQLQTLRFAKEI